MPAQQNSKICAKKDIQWNQWLEYKFSKNEIGFMKLEDLRGYLNFYTEGHTCMQIEQKEMC